MSALRRFTTNGNTHINGRYCDANEAMELIKQQAAEIDALKAHVEQLCAALKHLHHNAKASGAEMGLALDVAEETLESTPQQSLAERDAEVARKAFIAGCSYGEKYGIFGRDKQADKYAQRIKDGG